MILWPCVITMPDGAILGAVKAYYTPGAVDVWGWDDETQKAVIVAHGDRLDEIERDVYEIHTETGDAIFRLVVDVHACGCGHPLRYFRPAAPVR